jgi:hypothetical protein
MGVVAPRQHARPARGPLAGGVSAATPEQPTSELRN